MAVGLAACSSPHPRNESSAVSSLPPATSSQAAAPVAPPPAPEALTEVLSRIYGHPVAVQLQTDAALLGGLLISVGDEVIDGTLSSRLTTAEAQLPD